ncbi:hypothetical protein ACFL6C_01305 [Myxococcota bacterium]
MCAAVVCLLTCAPTGCGDVDSPCGYDNVRDRDIVITDGSGVDEIDGRAHIDGSVLLCDNPDLKDLRALQGVRDIDGRLVIRNNGNLKSTSGIEDLERVGEHLVVTRNKKLAEFSSAESLQHVEGNITFARNDSLDVISDLPSLEFVGGKLSIKDGVSRLEFHSGHMELGSLQVSNTKLVSIGGLQGAKVGQVGIYNNNDLLTLPSFDSLVSASIVAIAENPSLVSLDGFDALKSADGIEIRDNLQTLSGLGNLENVKILQLNNVGVSDLSGLTSLESVSAFWIADSPLESLTGLESLTQLGFFSVNRTLIKDFTGLENLTWLAELRVSTNPELESMDGLEGIVAINDEEGNIEVGMELGDLNIAGNEKLSNLDGLHQVRRIGRSLSITGNPSLPTCAIEELLDLVGRGNIGSSGASVTVRANDDPCDPDPCTGGTCVMDCSVAEDYVCN